VLRYMLDTNICIYVIKNKPDYIRQKFNDNKDGLCISSVTLAELYYGAEKSAKTAQNIQIIESFVARLTILNFDDKAAWHYGEIRAELERKGGIIGPYDLMIAGHARCRGVTLVSNNLREFDRVPGLRTDNWIEAPD